MRDARAEAEVLRAALRVESPSHGDRLEQRRLPGSILTDEERDLRMELQNIEITNGRQTEWVLVEGWVYTGYAWRL